MEFVLAEGNSNLNWTSVRLYYRHGRGNERKKAATWFLHNLSNAESRGFHRLPFHKMDSVTVSIFPPTPGDLVGPFFLWRKVNDLVILFRNAVVIKHLTIMLQKDRCGDRDWFDRAAHLGNEILPDRYDHDIVSVPFCRPRNVMAASIEAHSKELEDAVDWNVMNWAMDVVFAQSWGFCPQGAPLDNPLVEQTNYIDYIHEIPGNDIDQRVVSDCLLLHDELWQYALRVPKSISQQPLIKLFFESSQGSDGRSEFQQFERRILGVIDDYPKVVGYHRPISLLREHMAKVLLSCVPIFNPNMLYIGIS